MPVFYTNLFVRKGMAATTIGPFIFIRPEHKGKASILAHEKKHVEQWWEIMPFFWLLFRKDVRLKMEVEAYKVSLTYFPGKERYYAESLANKYDFGITVEEAEKLLRG